SYNFKKENRTRYGFIAEEVRDIIPELYDGPLEEDGGGLFYDMFIPLLVKEVQSLRKRIAVLENR
ncbi:MAG: tail fiber domain-containing protein, partial [Bacilli bacterium]|nr:tail fiber domain-containing protein [Bacilli bacterium]